MPRVILSASAGVRRSRPAAPGTVSCRSSPGKSARPLPRTRGLLRGARFQAPSTARQASDGSPLSLLSQGTKKPVGTRPSGLVAHFVVEAGAQRPAGLLKLITLVIIVAGQDARQPLSPRLHPPLLRRQGGEAARVRGGTGRCRGAAA